MIATVEELAGDMAVRGKAEVLAGAEREISGLSTDSRRISPGDAFFALPGPGSDGHRFLDDAVAAGAGALFIEKGRGEDRGGSGGMAIVEVENVRTALGEVADRFHGHPSGDLDLYGITGTNGKTSVAYLLEEIFRAAGMGAGMIGTVEYRWPGGTAKASCTTPEAHDLQRMLRLMADVGVQAVAMEVSSHALAQHRTVGCDFRAAIFTNLSRDHLDFHSDLEDYFTAKSRLFRDLQPRLAVINTDDSQGKRLMTLVPGGAVSYGRGEGSDYRARGVTAGVEGVRFSIEHGDKVFDVSSPLLGEHNVYNILAAAAAALECGIVVDSVVRGVSAASAIPGRFERVSKEGEPAVLVDYAHTPDALTHALRAARQFTGGRLIVVFGCGGDRDRGKRPLMGAAAAKLADITYLTSDNPRSEDPGKILGEVEAGFRKAVGESTLEIIPGRREAITAAIAAAAAGDTVLIAGKGHEDCQILAGGTIPFSDREEARRAIEERKR